MQCYIIALVTSPYILYNRRTDKCNSVSRSLNNLRLKTKESIYITSDKNYQFNDGFNFLE